MTGRPREHDRDKIALDLVEWAKRPDSVNLNKFCALEAKIAPSKLTEFAREDDNFRLAYEEAKAHLGYRREELLTSNLLHVKAYDLNASTYDYFLKQEKREQAEFEAKLSKETSEHIDDTVISQQRALIDMIHESKSARRAAAKSNNNDK